MSSSNFPQRRGSTVAELIVAGTLLITSMGLIARGTVNSQKLWQDTRRYQLALDELANQLGRITALEPSQRELAIAGLEPSEVIRKALPNANLMAERVSDEDGERIILSLQWDRPGQAAPVKLVGWLHSQSQATTATRGDQ